MKTHLLILILVVLLTFGLALVPGSVARAEFGSNWTAEYFDNPNLSGSPVATQIVQAINFNFGTDDPLDNVGLPEDNFSIRFTGTQTFAAGTYEFIVTSDDGVRVFIDGALVLDRFIGRAQTTDRFTQTLTAGAHTIRVEYFEGVDRALIQFQWFPVSTVVTPGPGTPIVSTALPGTPGVIVTPGTAVPVSPVPSGPQATVTGGVRGVAVRTGPYLGATIITVADAGRTYNVTGRNSSEGIYTWYLINVDGAVGWASGRFLNVNVDPNTIPQAGSVFDTIDGAPDVGVTAIARAVINVRARPSIRAPRITQMGYGLIVSVIGRTVRAGVSNWLQVRLPTGEVGWITADWVGIQGDQRKVPIR